MNLFRKAKGMNIWNLGFRPFFLFGIIWSIVHISIWVYFHLGLVSSIPLANSLIWHGHEMIFGYVLAIIAGFILTASQNWTGIPGISGSKLIFLVLVWGAARFLSFFWTDFPILFAIVDLFFVPLLAFFLFPYLGLVNQKQNRVFFLFFGGFFVSNIAIHLSVIGNEIISPIISLHFSIYICILMIALIGGRVIPFFTGIVFPDKKVLAMPWLEALSASSLTLFFLTACLPYSKLTFFLSLPAFIFQFIRWIRWRPWIAYDVPILFVLHISYLWIPIGIILTAFSKLEIIPAGLPIHAFTLGCIGMMIFGMATRVSLGHSGRAIRPAKIIVLGYLFIFFAALIRVFIPWLNSNFFYWAIFISGCLWVIAHLFFILIYAPILLFKRVDGRQG